MFYFLSTFTGMLIAVMVAVNGRLSDAYGAFLATVIIHVVGLVSVLAVWIIKGRPSMKPAIKMPFYFFLGGVVGVATTMFNILAFGKISVAALLALGLLGQCLASMAVDHFGLLGMEKRPIKKQKWIGAACVGVGIAAMMLF